MSKTKSISPAICSENVKNANIKKGFIGFHITNISLENVSSYSKSSMRIELVQWIHPWYETKDYKTRYILTIVCYEHAQMNYRVNRALLMETCQS